MKYTYACKKVSLNDSIKDYAEKKISKLDKYFREDTTAAVTFTVEKDHLCTVESTIRGGGTLLIRVYNSLPDEEIDREGDVTVYIDGCVSRVKAGTQLVLTPGMSISIRPGMYHDFEVKPGTGAILIGEVSQVNDDNTDNRFNPPVGRFPAIEEDEPPYRLLCNDYPPAPEK